jgi:hypothetical protein
LIIFFRTLALICFLTLALAGTKYFGVTFGAIVPVLVVVVVAVAPVAVVSTAKAEPAKRKESRQTNDTNKFFVFIFL